MFRKLLLLLVVVPLFLFSTESSDFYMISIAKSGTNLLQKYIEHVTDKKRLYCPEASIDPNYKLDNKFLGTHFFHTRALRAIENNFSSDKVLVNVRDPRDIFVSAAFFYSHLTYYFPGNEKNSKTADPFKDVPIKERVRAYLIEGMRGRKIPTPLYGIKAACEYLKNHSDCLLVKFEDLVGDKGGGTEKQQIKSIKKIAEYLKLELNDKDIEEVKLTIFGDTGTFRKGQIGAWKNYFDDEMKAMFKVLLGDELIFLGYETDMDW